MSQPSSSKYSHLPLAASGPLECPYKGVNLLTSSYFNKGSSFPDNERAEFELDGLLPPNVQTLDEQVKRAYQQYSRRGSDALGKNTFMASMKAQNQVLYYKLLQTHLKEMSSVIYTPTEGDAIQNYSRLFRKPEGIFLDILNQDIIETSLAHCGEADDIDYIVVTDGEEILGIGDQGVGGILISVAKLVLTTVCAGIHPARQLPVVLDCGTDNQELLEDELYLGLRRKRVRGEEYDNFVDSFVQAARKRFPKAYIHFEDFGVSNARRVLDRYRPRIPCFNDDIQGTGCVTLAAILGGLRIGGIELTELRLVVFGSGSAGIGIADQVRDTISTESGKPKDKAALQIWCLDKPGLLLKSHGKGLTPGQAKFARDDAEWEGTNLDLLSVVKRVKPHVLIGTSTKPKAFTEEVVKEMSKHVDRPIIFPLSNPTRLHEAEPKDINDWSKGKALIATGSPFPPVVYEGVEYEVAECNNSTCFPGIGLGVVLSRARLLSDKMLVAAVKALAAQSPALKDPNRGLLPDILHVREVSVHIATAVIRRAAEEGLAQTPGIPLDSGNGGLREWIEAQMWDPVYRPLILELLLLSHDDMFAATDLQDEVRCLPLQDLMDLWDKAINTPDNLTVEDRQQILGRVQPEADNQCKARCGLTLDALVLKAARQPDDLADDETKIIIWGPRSFGPGDSEEIKRRLRWPRELHERRRAATEAAETETECQARKNAWQVHLRISSQRRTVLERLRSDDERNIACCDQLDSFGDDASWEVFKEQITEAISTSLWAVENSDLIRKRWKIQWIEDESMYNNASIDELCQSFRGLCSNSEDRDKPVFEPGLRRDAFLYADSAAIESAVQNSPLPKRGFVVAVDASYTPEKLPGYYHGFKSSVRVEFTHAFTTFYARLIPRGDPEDNPSAKGGLRQSWDLLYFKARYDTKEKVYPPDGIINRI